MDIRKIAYYVGPPIVMLLAWLLFGITGLAVLSVAIVVYELRKALGRDRARRDVYESKTG